jgi:3D-(3,5/4)-trihydroxycyclohexane-1,2-dione acylhydrolase (decyclizing)
VVLVDHRGHRSIGSLFRAVGVNGFGASYEYRSAGGQLSGGDLPVDLGMNSASLGAGLLTAGSLPKLRDTLAHGRRMTRTVVIGVDTGPGIVTPECSWSDVPVAEISASEAVRAARKEYELAALAVRTYL